MSVLRSVLAALALLAVFGASAEAQGVVPGGWAAQFGYQPFGNDGFAGNAAFGVGAPDLGGVYFGGYSPYSAGASPYGFSPTYQGYGLGVVPPIRQTTVATDPLINAIRRSTRRPARR
jgi:hypothetical protein